MPKRKNLIGLIIFCFISLSSDQKLWSEDLFFSAVSTKGYSLNIKTYSIQIIPFKRYEIPAQQGMPEIVFAEYANEVKVVYPDSKDKIFVNSAEIVKKCQAVFESNIERVIIAEQENEVLRNYLSVDKKIALLKKEDYLRLINNPVEQIVQIEPVTGNIFVEFRLKETAIDKNTFFCQYITFIYNKDALSFAKNNVSQNVISDGVNKIIISAVRLIQ